MPMLHVNKTIPVTFEISGPCNCEYYTFWLCSKADGGYISVKTSSWFGTINKLLHLDWMYCTSDQNTEKHQQSRTQWSSTPSIWQENWQVQEREHFLFSKMAKKTNRQTDKQTAKQWVKAARAKPNNTARKTVILRPSHASSLCNFLLLWSEVSALWRKEKWFLKLWLIYLSPTWHARKPKGAELLLFHRLLLMPHFNMYTHHTVLMAS